MREPTPIPRDDHGADPDDRRVATGDRRAEIHYESDPDQLVKASHLVKPQTPVPPQMETAGQVPDGAAGFSPALDVRISPPRPSVWDARPPDDA